MYTMEPTSDVVHTYDDSIPAQLILATLAIDETRKQLTLTSLTPGTHYFLAIPYAHITSFEAHDEVPPTIRISTLREDHIVIFDTDEMYESLKDDPALLKEYGHQYNDSLSEEERRNYIFGLKLCDWDAYIGDYCLSTEAREKTLSEQKLQSGPIDTSRKISSTNKQFAALFCIAIVIIIGSLISLFMNFRKDDNEIPSTTSKTAPHYTFESIPTISVTPFPPDTTPSTDPRVTTDTIPPITIEPSQ